MLGPDAALSAPIALGGDSLAGNSVAIGALALVSMVIGYLLLAGLWYFVFRPSPAEREADRLAREARAEAVRQWRPSTGTARDDEPKATAPAGSRGHGEPLRIQRTRGSRFRRR